LAAGAVDMTAMRLFDDYDWAAVAAVVAVTLLGVMATGAWLPSFLLAAVLGNGAAYLLRRRANSNDRPLPRRMRARR
jgi:hypothetical protein